MRAHEVPNDKEQTTRIRPPKARTTSEVELLLRGAQRVFVLGAHRTHRLLVVGARGRHRRLALGDQQARRLGGLSRTTIQAREKI